MMNKNCLIIVLATVLLSGCVSSKKIIYFQGADEVYQQSQQITQQFDMRIKPADNITVKVLSTNPELLEVFKNVVTIGTEGNTGSYSSQGGGQLNSSYGYTVNKDGDVILPLLGHVHVGGLTTEEAGKVIEDKIKEAQIANDPEVMVRLMNARVAVLGGIKSPGVVNLTSERNTILDVLAQCGDVSDEGLKKNIKLFREENGMRTMYTIDLTDVNVFNSPAFYVQQNDLVYVEPNKTKNIKNSSFYTFLSAGSSLLAIVSSILSLYIVGKSL